MRDERVVGPNSKADEPNPSPSEGAAAPADVPIIELRNVSKTFNAGTPRAYTAIKDVNIKIDDKHGAGEFITIVGPSGCGKSTLINLIAGFNTHLPPTTGRVLVRGKEVTGPGADRGMIFQKYSSFPQRTVLGNVCFGLEINRERLGIERRHIQDVAFEWIRKVGLEDHVNKYPHQLSGGQQQRVAIARTLAVKPQILLMDEPFSALDEPTRLEMQRMLVSLWHETEATVLMITHSITEAVYLGDRVWVFTPAPGRVATEIVDCLPPAEDSDPLVLMSHKEFLDAVRIVGEEFERVTQGA